MLTREQLLAHKVWAHITSIDVTQRHDAILHNQDVLENNLGVKITFQPYSTLMSVPETSAAMSVKDMSTGYFILAVFTPIPDAPQVGDIILGHGVVKESDEI